MKEFRIGRISVEIVQGYLETIKADAVVSAANSHGHMRGGVAQALRRAGGDEIETEARRKGPVPLGQAIATTAGRLPAGVVIHAPTMRDPVEISSPARVQNAARAALDLAGELGCEVVAIPALGCGTGEVSFHQSADAVLSVIATMSMRSTSVRVVKLVVVEDAAVRAFTATVEKLLNDARSS